MKNERQRESDLRNKISAQVANTWQIKKMTDLIDQVNSWGVRRIRIAIYKVALEMVRVNGHLKVVALSKALKQEQQAWETGCLRA